MRYRCLEWPRFVEEDESRIMDEEKGLKVEEYMNERADKWKNVRIRTGQRLQAVRTSR